MTKNNKCICNYHLRLGPNLDCPIHGDGNFKQLSQLNNLSQMNQIRYSFVDRMLRELQSNSDKGDWGTYQPDKYEALKELRHHFNKLNSALFAGNADTVSEYCADIANISMKISELYGNS